MTEEFDEGESFEVDQVAPGEGAADVEPPRVESEVPITGDPRIDEVIEGLSALETSQIDDHPSHFAAAHEALREALTSSQGDPDRVG